MHVAADRLEFAPPPTPGLLRALLLALLAHGLLVAALTWGVNWRRDTQQTLSAEAELWAAVPQEAAPALQAPEPAAQPVTPPPPPQPAPEPVRQPVVPPEPVAKPKPAPPPVAKEDKVDIALEKEKQRQQKLKQLELEKQEKLKQDKLKAEQLKADKLKQEKLKAEKLKQEKLEQDKLKQEKLKQEQAEKARQAAAEKARAAEEARKIEALRKENLQRMTGLAGASGGPSATGTALKSAGPSASYAGRIRARIKPNIVFTEDLAGNPSAEVEVRTAPDGTITARKLIKSSGVKAWDDAVLRAIDKTEILPRDTNGQVPPVLEISFRPKD